MKLFVNHLSEENIKRNLKLIEYTDFFLFIKKNLKLKNNL